MELGLRSMAAAGAQGVMTMLNSPGGRFSFEPAAEATTAAASSSPGAAKGAAAGEGSAQPAAAAGQDSGSGQDSGGGGAAGAAAGPADFEAFLADVAQTGVVPLQMPLFCGERVPGQACRLPYACERLFNVQCHGPACLLLALTLPTIPPRCTATPAAHQMGTCRLGKPGAGCPL